MMALTIGSLAPLSAPLSAALHRSPLQQSTSHLVIFAEGSVGLQFFEPRLHSDEMAHPLRKNLSVFCGLSDFTSCVRQRSEPSIQVVSSVVFLQSSQLSTEKHRLHFRE